MHYPRKHAKVEENNNKSPSVDGDFFLNNLQILQKSKKIKYFCIQL